MSRPSAVKTISAAEAPSVVLITMDTVRADHLSLQGYERETAPNLALLAEGATLYARAAAAGDMTLSSHASLFTGQFPSWHGARPPATPLADSARTLAEILADKGYRTLAVVANTAFLRPPLGLAQGFQYYDQRLPILLSDSVPQGYLRDSVGRLARHMMPAHQQLPHYRRGEDVTAEVLHLLETIEQDGAAFFLFVNYMDAHTPYLPPPPFDTRFPGKDPAYSWSSYADSKSAAKDLGALPKREREHLVSQYDGGIAYVDAQIGTVIRRLRELGLYEGSLIVVTSDHGEAFGERGLVGHGVSVYQDQIHVPLIIKYPSTRRKQVVQNWVSGVDILPTILEVAGLPVPENVQGSSLFRGPAEPRAVLSESFQREGVIRALLTRDGLKLVASAGRKAELYDLNIDPDEEADRIARDGLRGAKLAEALRQRLAAGPLADVGEPVVDGHTLQELRALGYVR